MATTLRSAITRVRSDCLELYANVIKEYAFFVPDFYSSLRLGSGGGTCCVWLWWVLHPEKNPWFIQYAVDGQLGCLSPCAAVNVLTQACGAPLRAAGAAAERLGPSRGAADCLGHSAQKWNLGVSCCAGDFREDCPLEEPVRKCRRRRRATGRSEPACRWGWSPPQPDSMGGPGA